MAKIMMVIVIGIEISVSVNVAGAMRMEIELITIATVIITIVIVISGQPEEKRWVVVVGGLCIVVGAIDRERRVVRRGCDRGEGNSVCRLVLVLVLVLVMI